MLHKYCRLLFFVCKIGDFIIAGLVCLQKNCLHLLTRDIFSNSVSKTKYMAVHYIVYSISISPTKLSPTLQEKHNHVQVTPNFIPYTLCSTQQKNNVNLLARKLIIK